MNFELEALGTKWSLIIADDTGDFDTCVKDSDQTEIQLPVIDQHQVLSQAELSEFDQNQASAQIESLTIGKSQIELVEKLSTDIKNLLSDFEQKYSRFIKTSFIRKISEVTGEFSVDDEFIQLLEFYSNLYSQTEGKFTPLIGRQLVNAGYDENYSFNSKKLEQIPSLHEAISLDTKNKKLHIYIPVVWDFGGVGKGYMIDKVADYLKSQTRVKQFTINAGGDIYTHSRDQNILRCGLEHPYYSDQLIGVLELKHQSLCGSSGNRRVWGDFHHILDPETRTSPTNIIATWVIADTALIADSLATTLFLVEPERLIQNTQFEYLILYKDFTFKKSQGFEADLFFQQSRYA